jgi:hypothetical protein
MFEGFTETARDLVILAQEEARVLRHERIGTEHLVLGFLRVRPGALTLAPGKRNITLAAARRAVIRFAGMGSVAQSVSYLPYSPRAADAIESASALSRERGEEQVEPEHVLLALLGQAEPGSGTGQVLGALRADLPDLRRQARRGLDDARAKYAGDGAGHSSHVSGDEITPPGRRLTSRLPQPLAGISAAAMDVPADRKRRWSAIAWGASLTYAAWVVAVYFSGNLSGYRLIFQIGTYALLTLAVGALTYFIGKNFDSAIEGWQIASPLPRIFLPVFYLALAVFPLALAVGIALPLTFAAFGKQRVMYPLAHLNSVITVETKSLLLAPVLLAIACFLFFVPSWHYSWAPIRPLIKMARKVSNDLPDDFPDGLTSWLDVTISKLWERRYTSFGTELLNTITLGLRTSFLMIDHTFFGGENRIDEAAANARAAAEACLRNPQLAKNYRWAELTLGPLADALWMLFQVRPDKGALDDAISARRWLRESRSWLVLSSADHKVNAYKLAALLASRFEITGILQDLTEALALARTAAPAIRDADSRAEALLTLGRIEQIRFEWEQTDPGREQTGRVVDSVAPSAFAAAAEAYRAAASAEDKAGEAEYRLALLLAKRAELDGDDTCRREALELLRPWAEKAKASDPDGDEFIVPEQRAQFMIGLADVLASWKDESTTAEAATWYQCAAAIDDAPVSLRLAAACSWGYYAQDAANAAAGFDAAEGLLQQAVWPGLGPSAQVRRLARRPELTVDAAAAQITAGQPERAVEILEQGRVLMWSQRVALRSASLDRLRDADPELFQRLTAIRAELNAPVIRRESGIERFGRSNAGAERRAALFREWDDAARRHDLLRIPSYQDLRAAAARGPVVVLNASRQRCDALIITQDLPVHQLKLPAEVYERTRAVVHSWRRAAQARAALDQDAADPKRLGEALKADDDQKKQSDAMLAWLWRDVAEPVLRWLADNHQLNADGGELPRLWWCPTGWLTHLPLHAAGLADSAGNSVLDRVVSSYTPSLSQLIRARQSSAEQRPGPSGRAQMLVLAPDSGLDYAHAEADLVGRLFPGHCRLPGDADKAAYLREISRHSVLHFVGHGYASEHEEISGNVRVGGLVLNSGSGPEGFISPRELSELPLDGARFAYLSICDAAAPDSMLLDEAVHPAAALHFCGFRNVIATLSPAADVQAMSVAKSVYSALASDGILNDDRSARALHDAVCELRRKRGGRWGRWTTYLHIGP